MDNNKYVATDNKMCLFPPQQLQVKVAGNGDELRAQLRWLPPAVNANAVGGYLVERTTWWHGVPPEKAMLLKQPQQELEFVDEDVAPDMINEYRVFAVHRSSKNVQPVPSFPAAVYGFAYVRYAEMVADLQQLAAENADVCRLLDAGPASGDNYRIWCMVLGVNSGAEPNLPGVMLVGNPHAAEIQGADMLLGVIHEAIKMYRQGDPVFKDMFKTVQIRIIPMYNPHGRELLERGGPFPSRKTHPPITLPPPADPLQRHYCWHADYAPGLDPNRTFDAEWSNQGDYGRKESAVYSGEHPCAAPETQALVKMARAFRPQISVHYHGPCGAPLYPGSWRDGTEPADSELFLQVGSEFAARSVSTFAGEDARHSPMASTLEGVAIRWFYKEFYGAHLCPEGFHEQLPANNLILPITPRSALDDLVPHNLEALVYLTQRVRNAGINVHATDVAGRPVRAEVEVIDQMDAHCLRQFTDAVHGRYRRIMAPGTYTLKVSYEGETQTFANVEVLKRGLTELHAVFGGELENEGEGRAKR